MYNVHNVDFVQYAAPVSKIVICMTLGYIRHWGIFAIEMGWTLEHIQGGQGDIFWGKLQIYTGCFFSLVPP